MFKVHRIIKSGYSILSIINESSGEKLDVIPERGGMINYLELKAGGKLWPVISGCVSDKEILENPGFRGARLFPFPNRINKGTYSFDGQEYSLDINFPAQGHAIHGFVYGMPFDIISGNANGDRATVDFMLDYKGELQGYPFPFKLLTTYTMDANGFSCITKFRNTGKTRMPVGDGWHPYFSFDGNKVNDLSLQLPKCSKLEVDENMIPSGRMSGFQKFDFFEKMGDIDFDTGFKLSEGIERCVTKLRSEKDRVQINIWQEGYPYLQVYTPPDRDSIAIEPMTCAADAFNNGMGLCVLSPGEIYKCSFGVRITETG